MTGQRSDCLSVLSAKFRKTGCWLTIVEPILGRFRKPIASHPSVPVNDLWLVWKVRVEIMQRGIRILHNQPYTVHRANRKQLQDEFIVMLPLPATLQYHLILFQLSLSLLLPCNKGSIEDHAVIAAKVYAREECHNKVAVLPPP